MSFERAASSTQSDDHRPFGAHLRMRWWVPLLLTLVVVLATYGLQFGLGLLAGVIEIGTLGKDPADASLTPLTYLATNLAIILIAPLAVLVLAKAGRVPWRSMLAVRRSFDWRRLGGYLVIFAVVMVVVNVAIQIAQPPAPDAFAITGTSVALLLVILLTTPLQAAAEEITFRGVLTASYASWIRAARPALVLGIVLSTALFTILHTSSDLWMNLHYVGLGASTATMAVFARGLEPAIAFHVMSNVFAMSIGAVFSSGEGIGQDRSAGAAGPYMLIAIAGQVVAVVLVLLIERRRSSRERG